MDQNLNEPVVVSEPAVEVKKKRPWGKIILLVIVLIVIFFGAVQYLSASKYEALEQVVNEDKIGVNPTSERLDFGDLPRDKNAVRSIILQSKGSTPTHVWVLKTGDIADLIKVDRNNFTLKPNTTEKLNLSIYIPNSAEFRYYKGKVIIFRIPKFW